MILLPFILLWMRTYRITPKLVCKTRSESVSDIVDSMGTITRYARFGLFLLRRVRSQLPWLASLFEKGRINIGRRTLELSPLLIFCFHTTSSTSVQARTLSSASSLLFPTMATIDKGDGKFHFAIDRGGTFTDVVSRLPDGTEVVSKLLSEDPQHYMDAPTEGIRRVLEEYDKNSGIDYSRGRPVTTEYIGSIRMGTTVATNALLERQGAKMALITTKGFGDLLEIGNQARPDIFDLSCATPSLLYERVVQVDERVLLEQFCSSSYASQFDAKVGITKESILVEKIPDLDLVKKELEVLRDEGITALAIAFLHAYTFADHEKMVGDLASSMNCFEQISMSHEVMPMVKMVPRGHTSCAAAYLTPKITTYLAR